MCSKLFSSLLSIANSVKLSYKLLYVYSQKLSVLLQLTQRNLIHWSEQLRDVCKHLSLSSMVVDIQQLQSHSGDSITHSLHVPLTDYV